jgi:hypothetical protein
MEKKGIALLHVSWSLILWACRPNRWHGSRHELRCPERGVQESSVPGVKMPHSIQVLDGRSERPNDVALLVFLGFALKELTDHPARYPDLSTAGPTWAECRAIAPPGAIDLRLDESMSQDAPRSQFLALLQEVRRQIERFGQSIPRDELDSLQSRWPIREIRPGVPSVSFSRDFPTNLLLVMIDELTDLVGRRIQADATGDASPGNLRSEGTLSS